MKKLVSFVLAFLLITLVAGADTHARVMADPSDQSTTEQSSQSTQSGQKSPLKGSVQHSEVIKPGLESGIQDNQLESNTARGKLDVRKGLFRGRVGHQLRDQGTPDAGLGIIGVKFVLSFGRPPIIDEVFPNTPAEAVGLRPHDAIVAVDGVPTFGLSKDDVYNMIVGEPGTAVTLTIHRAGNFQVHKMVRMDLNKIADPYLKRDYFKM